MSKPIKCNDLHYKIYVEDTDFQGFVYHANYLKYFERSRSEFLSNINISHRNLRKIELGFVVRKININYFVPAQLGDEIIVQSSVENNSRARMTFHQKVISSKNKKEFVNGEVEVCFINLATKKPQKFPDDLLLIFEQD